MLSVWSASSVLPELPALSGDIRTDVLIIGGGLCGILCAYELSRAGVDCTLVEAGRVCGGVTGNTTAKITSQHGLIYSKLLRRFGAEKASMYLRANENALRKYRSLCEGIDCDFVIKDNYVYSIAHRDKLEREADAFNKIGFQADFIENVPLPFDTAGAVRLRNQAQFNPLRFVSAIIGGLNIYENTRVQELIGCTAVTAHGRITARKIIAATHFPFINKHGSYFLKLYQSRSYVLALENAADVGGMYIGENDDASLPGSGMSFRNYGKLLLIGGGSHRTGKNSDGWTGLTTFAAQHYAGSTERYRWAAQDCMSLDEVPYIGRYSSRTADMYVATGFNKWGMSTSMAAASILADLVQGRNNQYAPVFSPSRSVLRPQLAVNAAEAVANLLTFSAKRCPHLGCALKWNAQERSWDCPCHGSRFTEDGRVLDNPSNGNLKK